MKNKFYSCVLILFGTVLAFYLPIRGDTLSIDPITGSMKEQTSWLIFSLPARVRSSAIEAWIKRKEAAYQPRWKFLSRGTKTVSGHTLARACSPSPPIYRLASSGQFDVKFVRIGSDDQIARFVNVMRTGTIEEQQKAVADAIALTMEK